MIRESGLVLAGVEPVMQPSPARNPRGDCFACALTAGLRHVFPEPGRVDFGKVWEYFLVEAVGGSTVLSNTWPTMRTALYRAYSDVGPLDIVADIVRPEWQPERWPHTWWHFEDIYRYGQRLEGWLAAGWLALSVVNYAGTGLTNPDGTVNGDDHFVLLDGVRFGMKSYPDGGGAWDCQVHVVCSARGAYWIGARDLLRNHGAAAWWLFRPRAERELNPTEAA